MDTVRTGKIVTAYRERRGWSRNHLAKRAGVSETVLREIEHGVRSSDGRPTNPSRLILRKVAAAVGPVAGAEMLRELGFPEMADDLESEALRQKLTIMKIPANSDLAQAFPRSAETPW